MFEMALKCFPEAESQTIILKEELYKKNHIKKNPSINFIPINQFTKVKLKHVWKVLIIKIILNQ